MINVQNKKELKKEQRPHLTNVQVSCLTSEKTSNI